MWNEPFENIKEEDIVEYWIFYPCSPAEITAHLQPQRAESKEHPEEGLPFTATVNLKFTSRDLILDFLGSCGCNYITEPFR